MKKIPPRITKLAVEKITPTAIAEMMANVSKKKGCHPCHTTNAIYILGYSCKIIKGKRTHQLHIHEMERGTWGQASEIFLDPELGLVAEFIIGHKKQFVRVQAQE